MKKTYWPTTIDDIIIQYNNTTDDTREYLYRTWIHTPLTKLVEYTVNKYAITEYDWDDVYNELISHLVLKLENYDDSCGKSFSYFSVIARHYIWQYNRNFLRDKHKLVNLYGVQYMTVVQNEDHYEPYQDELPKTYYKVKYPEQLRVYQSDNQHDTPPSLLFQYILSNTKCGGKKQRDSKIVEALQHILVHLKTRKKIHKKEIYAEIREMTGYDTVHIRNVISRIKRNFKKHSNMK